MAYRRGAIVTKRGKFFIIELIMGKDSAGVATYTTPYGTYIHEKETIAVCRNLNRIPSCSQCPNSSLRKGKCAVG